MREKVIETKLIQAVRRSGGLALKLVSPGFNGVPDRLLLFMGGKAAFCEVKAPGQKPRPLQVHRIEQLRALGFRVYVVDSEEKIGGVIERITEGLAALHVEMKNVIRVCDREDLITRWNNDQTCGWRTDDWLQVSLKSLPGFASMENAIDTSDLPVEKIAALIMQ